MRLKRRSFSVIAVSIRKSAFTSPKQMGPVPTARGVLAAGIGGNSPSEGCSGALKIPRRAKNPSSYRNYSPGSSENTRASWIRHAPWSSSHRSSTTRVSPSVRWRCTSVRLATVPIRSPRAVRSRSGPSSVSRSANSAAKWAFEPSTSPALSVVSNVRATRCTSSLTETSATRRTLDHLPHGLDDLGRQAGEGLEVCGPLGLEAGDAVGVLGLAPLRRVEPARLEDVDVGVVDPRDPPGDAVAEVGIGLPLDRPLGDPLHDGRGVRDQHLLGALVAVAAADAAGVQDVDVDRVQREQLEEAIPLEVVREREERVRARDAQELALLVRAARRRARGLAQHEERRGLRAL